MFFQTKPQRVGFGDVKVARCAQIWVRYDPIEGQCQVVSLSQAKSSQTKQPIDSKRALQT